MAQDQELTSAEELKQLDALTNESHSFEITDLDGNSHKLVTQTFNTFKTKRVLQMLAAVREKVDVIALVAEIVTMMQPAEGDEAKTNQTFAAFSAVPKLMEFAPDLLLDFGSLAMIPNREVAKAYRENTLDELCQKNREWLDFEFDASIPLKLLVKYLPFVGIDFLARELGALNKTVENIAPKELKTDTTG